MINVPLEHDAVLTQFKNIKFMHITRRILDQSGSHTSDCDITIQYVNVVDIVPECYC